MHSPPYSGAVGGLDLDNGFYQFGLDTVSDYFCLDDDFCAGPGYEHHAYTALRVAAAAAALAAVVCAALCLRCCWRRLFRRRREKRD